MSIEFPEFTVGQNVTAKIRMIDDYTEHGLGIRLCAEKGDELMVREVHPHGRYAVSHHHITDRSFIATNGELEAA